MASETGTCKEKISTWTEILTQLVEAKFFSRLDAVIKFFRSKEIWHGKPRAEHLGYTCIHWAGSKTFLCTDAKKYVKIEVSAEDLIVWDRPVPEYRELFQHALTENCKWEKVSDK